MLYDQIKVTVELLKELNFHTEDLIENFFVLQNVSQMNISHEAALNGCSYMASQLCIRYLWVELVFYICEDALHEIMQETNSTLDFENYQNFRNLSMLSMAYLNELFNLFANIFNPIIKKKIHQVLVKYKYKIKKKKELEILLEDSYTDPSVAAMALTTTGGIKTRNSFFKSVF